MIGALLSCILTSARVQTVRSVDVKRSQLSTACGSFTIPSVIGLVEKFNFNYTYDPVLAYFGGKLSFKAGLFIYFDDL